MSARLLYSLTEDKAGGGGNKHVGCMNGIFHLFDRRHFLPGGRRSSRNGLRRLAAGQDESYGAEDDDVMSVKSTTAGKVSKAVAVKDRHRLSTDSSRSSASSSCSFSSVENPKFVRIEPANSVENRAKDLPRLQQFRGSKGAGENPQPKSADRMYVDSPRPVAPSKVARERSLATSESFRDSRSLDGPRNFVDSPRLSYDGRGSRDEIKSRVMKLKDQPRHSLDSKRSSLSSLSLKVQEAQVDPDSCKWQSSVVAKLMGLEAGPDVQASSKPQLKQGRSSSVDALDPSSVLSRTANNCRHEANADLVVRLKQDPARVINNVSAASKESPLQSPTLSVYGELEKRLEEIEFARSSKDLRALKQILEAMQRSEQTDDDRKKIHHAITGTTNIGEFTGEFADHGDLKSPAPMTTHEVWRPMPLTAKEDTGFDAERIQSPRNGISGLPKIQVSTKVRRNSLDQQRADDLTTPRTSPRQAHYTSRIGVSTYRAEESRQNAEGNIRGRNFGDSSPRPPQKKLEPLLARDKSNQPGRRPRQSHSPHGALKSKVFLDLSSRNSRKLTGRTNHISTQSDNDARGRASRDDDAKVTSPYVVKKIQPAQVLSRSKVDEESHSESGSTLGEQPSPVSVLGSSYMGDESPSPVKMILEACRDGEVSSVPGKCRGLHTSRDLFPNEKHSQVPKKPQAEKVYSDHTYILQTLSSSGLLGNSDADNLMTIRLHPSGAVMTNVFPALGQDKLGDNLLASENLGEGCFDQSQLKRRERIQKKLMFDVIDEILVQKLTSDDHGNPFLPHNLSVKKTGQEKLLKGLHSEIAHLHNNNNNSTCDVDDEEEEDEDIIKAILRRDLEHESQSRKGTYDDSGIVLHIERLIFKDLVTEVVTDEAAVLWKSLN